MNGHTDEHDEILQANSLFSLKSIIAAFIWRHSLENILRALLLALNSLANCYLMVEGKQEEGKRLKLVCLGLEETEKLWMESQSWTPEQLNERIVLEETEKLSNDATFENELGKFVEEIRTYQLITKGKPNNDNRTVKGNSEKFTLYDSQKLCKASTSNTFSESTRNKTIVKR